MSLRLRFIKLFQAIAPWFVLRLLKTRGDVSVIVPFKFDANERYLFVANHQSRLDPFAVFATLTFSEMQAIVPIRFMTAGKIYYSYLYPFLALCGCYPTRKKHISKYDPVAQSIYYLEHEQNVFIFPEGRRTLQSESQPRIGVKRIYEGTYTPLVLVLIHLEWTYAGKRCNLRVVFDKGSEIKSPESLMEQLYRL